MDSDQGHWRPTTRKDCELVARPCPYVGCKYHLAVDAVGAQLMLSGERSVNARVLNAGDGSRRLEQWSDDLVDLLGSMPETCALDAAEEGGLSHRDVAGLLGVTKQRVRHVEKGGLVKLRKRVMASKLLEYLDDMSEQGGALSALAEAQQRSTAQGPRNVIDSLRMREP